MILICSKVASSSNIPEISSFKLTLHKEASKWPRTGQSRKVRVREEHTKKKTGKKMIRRGKKPVL